MNKNQHFQITSLYYRLYVTYFEANADILKATNRNAFYRLFILDGETLLAEMVEGINPVILADKIFLNSAVLNFRHLVSKPTLKVQLRSYYGYNETRIGQADLDLQRINDNYFQFSQRFNSLQSIAFASQKGDLKLVFNIFVEKNKADLDFYIKKYKQNEKEVMRAKRYVARKKKVEAQEKATDLQNTQNSSQNIFQVKEVNPAKITQQVLQRERSRSRSTNRKKMVQVITQNSGNYLQINSAAKVNDFKWGKKQNSFKNMMQEIKEKQLQASPSQVQTYPSSKILSYDIGSNSIISDGSEESQMIKNNSSQTYSEKAVANFKQKSLRCLNIILLILVVYLLFVLLTPKTRILKNDKAKAKKRMKMSKMGKEIIHI